MSGYLYRVPTDVVTLRWCKDVHTSERLRHLRLFNIRLECIFNPLSGRSERWDWSKLPGCSCTLAPLFHCLWSVQDTWNDKVRIGSKGMFGCINLYFLPLDEAEKIGNLLWTKTKTSDWHWRSHVVCLSVPSSLLSSPSIHPSPSVCLSSKPLVVVAEGSSFSSVSYDKWMCMACAL